MDATTRRLEQLNRHLSWLGHRRLAQELSAYGLTPSQFFVLACLDRSGSNPIHELAESTFQVPATMTGIVDRLERSGLVRRERDKDDRRIVRVSITAQGRVIVGRVRQARQERLQEAAQGLSAEERQILIRFLERLIEVLGGDLEALEVPAAASPEASLQGPAVR